MVHLKNMSYLGILGHSQILVQNPSSWIEFSVSKYFSKSVYEYHIQFWDPVMKPFCIFWCHVWTTKSITSQSTYWLIWWYKAMISQISAGIFWFNNLSIFLKYPFSSNCILCVREFVAMLPVKRFCQKLKLEVARSLSFTAEETHSITLQTDTDQWIPWLYY